jgi:hypothetical protein
MPQQKLRTGFIVTCLCLIFLSAAAFAENVRITPLGSHDGEFCSRDRVMLFESPDGTTLLFDIGRTVAGPDDPRLGKVDAVLLIGVHGDHIGDSRIAQVEDGTCAKPQTDIKTLRNSKNTWVNRNLPGNLNTITSPRNSCECLPGSREYANK